MNRCTFIFDVLVCFFISALLSVAVSEACQICVPYPEDTLADRLLENDEILFARESVDSPYVFYPVEMIRGPLVNEPIEMFCDSMTRRKLKAIPDSAIVLARMSDNDNWRLITFADSDFQAFIRTIISIGSNWPGRSDNQVRLHFFSKLLTSEHPRIQQEAYLEVGRAPYSLIKHLAKIIPREQIYDLLHNYRLVEWHNLYILMLGQSSDPYDLEYIRNKVNGAARFGTTLNLAAWLTAFMESHPETGVEEVESMYFKTSGRTQDEIEQVLTSMSVLGSQTTSPDRRVFALRTKILSSYGSLLEHYPEMAGNVAKDLASWRVRAYVDRISEIRRDPALLDPSSAYLVDYYLSAAPGFRSTNSFDRPADAFSGGD